MSIQVETLEKLKRKITLTVPTDGMRQEVESRLKRLARTVKADGFRPGKVPMSIVAQRYGYSVEYEVMNDKVGEAFSRAATEAKLRIAGAPKLTQKQEAAEGQLAFDAEFEVYPEVDIGDLSLAEVERIQSEVTDAAIDKTIDILRKQRRHFHPRGESHGDAAQTGGNEAQEGDQVTIDFEGKIDGEAFQGGAAQDFSFILGEGQMLAEFEAAVTGMKAGDRKTFPLKFPDDYHGKDVAGKQADFMITVKEVKWAHLPEVDAEFAKGLGIGDGSLEALRADIKRNLEREVKFRVMARNKASVMDALSKAATLDIPQALVDNETERLVAQARADLKQRGVKDADKAPIPSELFTPQAEKRVRLGLVVAELVKAQDLHAKPEQIRAHIEELAASYEKPQDVVRWYYGDQQRLAEVEAIVLENNVTSYVLAKAKVTDKSVAFDELMAS
jgi:trigger factor